MEVIIGKLHSIRFCVVVASHHNGVAKRSIKTVIYMDFTIMIHAAMIRPEVFITTGIRPMVVDYALWVYNITPK